MKKCLFFCFILLFYFNLQAQHSGVNFENHKDVEFYFYTNLETIDEIEGIYDCSAIPYISGGNGLTGLRKWGGQEFSSFVYILKKDEQNYYCYIKNANDFHMHKLCTITRLGESNAYRFTGYFKEHYSHFGNSGTLAFDISTRFVFSDNIIAFKFSGNDAYHKVDFEISMVKIYPTMSMLEESKNKIQEKEEQIQEWTGSGFALRDGYIVTNYHVVENAKFLKVKGVNGDFNNQYIAEVVAQDKFNDLAILKINDSNFSGFGSVPYKIKSSMSDVGTSVWTLGYPMLSIMGDEIKFTDGKISSKSGIQGDLSVYQVSIPIQPGNSGSPVFDNNGYVVGIASSGLNREVFDSENVNYAIKSTYLRNLIESSLSLDILPTGVTMQGKSTSEQIKLAKNFVYMILCSSEDSLNNINKDINIDEDSVKVYIYPKIGFKYDNKLTLMEVKIDKEQTILKFVYNNTDEDSWYSFVFMDSDAYILVDEIKYKMQKADGIEIYPKKTYFTGQDQSIIFTLYFPPVPLSTKVFNFIESEDSSWKIYDIKLK